MVASKELQNAYLDLYKIMREYLWDVDTLEDLSDVEVEVFTAFIDRDKLHQALYLLRRDIQPSFKDDEELEEAFEALQELADNEEDQYAELYDTGSVKGGIK